MADIATHYLIARVPTSRFAKPLQAAVLLGTVLPDILSHGMDLLLESPHYYVTPSHSILGTLFYTYLVAFLFEEKIRGRAWGMIWVGALLHVLLDLCKENMGAGILAILSPFSVKRFGFELYDPYSWIGTVPIAFGLVLLWELAVRKRGHRVWE